MFRSYQALNSAYFVSSNNKNLTLTAGILNMRFPLPNIGLEVYTSIDESPRVLGKARSDLTRLGQGLIALRGNQELTSLVLRKINA